jgi:hypothetical protein
MTTIDNLRVDDDFRVIPAFTNYHDHLELNHYPRTRFSDVYANAHEWGEDVNQRLTNGLYHELRAHTFWDKAFIGALKNLLCGVTTIYQHGEPKRELFRHDFPIRVVRRYAWAHSLHFTPSHDIQRIYRATPRDVPFFIHLAEGTDALAQGEYQRLKQLGCVGKNTVIVHGVGMTADDIADAVAHGCRLVWCPSTNAYLLGHIANISAWGERVWLGSDSRLTAHGDWLDEYHIAKHHSPSFVLPTSDNNDQVWLQDERDMPQKRADIALIIKNGIPQIGDERAFARFPKVQSVACVLDCVNKRMNNSLARLVHQCKLKEQGLAVDALPQKKFWLFSTSIVKASGKS